MAEHDVELIPGILWGEMDSGRLRWAAKVDVTRIDQGFLSNAENWWEDWGVVDHADDFADEDEAAAHDGDNPCLSDAERNPGLGRPPARTY